jgi:hypothetical protein
MKMETARKKKAGKPLSKLVVVADSGRLKAYRLDDRPEFSRPRLTLVQERVTEVTHHLSEDLTDQFGRFAKVPTTAVGAHSDGEEHNLELERRHRAIKTLGTWLGELIEQEQPEVCYFAADSRINQPLLDAMEPGARNKIQINIQANLSKLRPDELLRQFCSHPPPQNRT